MEVPSVGFFRWHWRDSAYSYKCYRGLVCRFLAVVNWCPLWRTLWIGSKEGNPDFYASTFFLCIHLQMHIFVLITSVVVYFCSRLPADPKYLDVLKTRVHSILCQLLNLITDYYFWQFQLFNYWDSPSAEGSNFWGGSKSYGLLSRAKSWGSSCSLCSPCSNAHGLECCVELKH